MRSCATGGVFCGGRFAGRAQNGIVKNELFNQDMPFGLVSTLAFYQVAMRFVSAVSVLVANTPIVSARLLESLQLAFDKRIAIGARGIFETCVANGKIVVGIEIVPTRCAREATWCRRFSQIRRSTSPMLPRASKRYSACGTFAPHCRSRPILWGSWR